MNLVTALPNSVGPVVGALHDLHVVVHPPAVRGQRRPGRAVSEQPSSHPAVVLVHGSLDRGDSFRRVIRRLEGLTAVTLDRRGYQRSRNSGPPGGVSDHVDDLLTVLQALEMGPRHPVVVVGHSFGGTVALGAAERRPDLVAGVGAYEPPLPWLGFRSHRRRQPRDEPGLEAERFFRRMVGETSWDRLPEREKVSRRADGPALVAELASLNEEPFDVLTVSVPVVIGRGGEASAPHHRQGTLWLSERLPTGELFEIPSAGHGAHLSHPSAFADLVHRVVRKAALPETGSSRHD